VSAGADPRRHEATVILRRVAGRAWCSVPRPAGRRARSALSLPRERAAVPARRICRDRPEITGGRSRACAPGMPGTCPAGRGMWTESSLRRSFPSRTRRSVRREPAHRQMPPTAGASSPTPTVVAVLTTADQNATVWPGACASVAPRPASRSAPAPSSSWTLLHHGPGWLPRPAPCPEWRPRRGVSRCVP
jgi:hypothetical protein